MGQQYVYGKNVVRQLLEEDKKIYEIILMDGFKDAKILNLLKGKKFPVKTMNRHKMDAKLDGNHQGIAALIDEYKMYTLEEVLADIPEGKTPLLLMLDGLEDPHNLGAIIRTAEAAGVHGIIIPKRRSASLNYTVGKTSAGALEYMKVARVPNLAATLDELKEKGMWVYGADMDGEDIRSVNLDGAAILVIGSEGDGMSRIVREKCDFIVSLKMKGQINSLNASVAGGILMYEFAYKR